MNTILSLFKLTLYGKISFVAKIIFNSYKFYLKLKFNKMSDTEKIKEILKPSIKLAVEIIDDYKDDKKIKLNELIGLIPEVLGFVKVVPNFKEALAKLKTFDLEDAQEIIEYVKSLKDLDDTTAKVIIVNVVELYEKAMDAYEDNIKTIIGAL